MPRKIRKDFTYNILIKYAISAHPSHRPTTSEIFRYAMLSHPTLFTISNSMTWRGNIRQQLSLSPEFVKLPKEEGSKQHRWRYVPIEEIRAEEAILASYLGMAQETENKAEYRKIDRQANE